MASITINTIAELIRYEHKLRAHCSCGHWHQFDLHALGARLGMDHSTMHDDLVPKLKCSACVRKKEPGRIGLILAPPPPDPNRRYRRAP